MNLLLDTHLFIWWLSFDKKLSKQAQSLIEDAQLVYISSVSIWEIAIKIQLQKLELDLQEVVGLMESEGFKELSFNARHAEKILELPCYHRDPFDRALIAQAIVEPLRFLSSDQLLEQYSELVQIV